MSERVYPAESVYNCITEEEAESSRPPRYVSKFRPAVVEETRSVKDWRRTMGPAEVEAPCPLKYLKKRSKEAEPSEPAQVSSKGHHRGCACSQRKPSVPGRRDNPLMGIPSERNFTRTNASVASKPRPTCVDSHRGHKELLENSGLVPKYTHKKDYGEVPDYLLRRHQAELRAQQEYQRFVSEQKEEVAMTQLTKQERQATLEGLKRQWDVLLGEYQGLPLVIDTLSDRKHKQKLEEAMDQLQKDISLLERFKTIYIPKY